MATFAFNLKHRYHTIMIRKATDHNPLLRMLLVICAAILLIFNMSDAIAATSILNVDQSTTSVDIAEFGKSIAKSENTITIQGPGDAQPADIHAKGDGPIYYWSLYSIHNSGDSALDFVVEIDPQHFAGSGILKLEAFGEIALGAVTTAGGGELIKPFRKSNDNAFIFTLNSGQSLNIAIQSSKETVNPVLWQRQAFENHVANTSFFLGVLLGISFLITLTLLALYSFRPHNALLAAWFFAIACLVFMVFESGLLLSAIQSVMPTGLTPPILRACLESLLGISLLSCILAFTSVRKKSPLVGFALLLVGALLCANIVFAFVEADRATSVARIGFAILVGLGFAITAWCKKATSNIVDAGFLFWLSLGAWTIFAGILTQSVTHDAKLSILLLAALATVLIAMTMVLLQFVLTQGLASKPFITDANRRSLALNGARHTLFDWQVTDHFLDIGEELPRALGYDPRSFARNAEQRFLEIMHPIDAAAYQSEMDGDGLQVGRNIDLELRLKNVDGNYLWYELRSRVVPGPNQMADRCIGTLTDITKQKEIEERMLQDAVHDPVTGLPSRALFVDRAERELTKPIGLQLRIMLIDLDRFKVLNEALGHDQGDRLLQAAGARIQDCLNEDESVARISGSQFAVLAIETIAQRSAHELAKNISQALAEPLMLGQQEVTLLCSVGISNASQRGQTVNDMQKQAASALLEAHRRGGAQIVLFDANLKDDRASDLAFESELRRAISGDEIEVHFQPICNLADMQITGLEALARWRHPTRGLLPPLEFINLAEQAGMIGEIGQIVLASAARQLGVWQRVLRRDDSFFVAVNISPSHFLQSGFLEQVQAIIRREGLKAHSLKIEVTESVIMRHPDRAMRLFERLRSLGVGLACDDFGTGFSNLSSIRDLPFDTLKIDKSFLAPNSFDNRGGIIISTIAELAHGLGMIVVAEGIETQEQIDRLAQLGCDLGQGYFIGEPKPANQITDMLAVLPRFALEQQEQMKPSVSLFDAVPEELEVLPSIFELPKADKPTTKKKPKVKRPVRRAKKS